MKLSALIILMTSTLSTIAYAAEKTVTMNAINNEGMGAVIGTIKFSDTDGGLLIVPSLLELTPGPHGFHIHEKSDCGTAEKDGKKLAGMAAGGHFDPLKTSHHEGPEGYGHQGDLPALMVNEDGSATRSLIAPRMHVDDLNGHTVMIHEGGDNYSDEPKPLGGGGARIACGVVY